LPSKKTIIISSLSVGLIAVTLLLTSQDKADNGLSLNTSLPQNTVKSLAKPNWWKKPVAATLLPVKMSKQKNTPVSNQREPLGHFMKMANAQEWKIMESQGIASAKYELLFEGKSYVLAIIRMNAKVPLNEVLSIWQNKVGLVAKSAMKSISIITKKKQNFELFTLTGEQKTILLAVHKAEKYTFFRLLSDQKIDEKVIEKFKDLLFEIEIKN
jgi:hypothetical protein